MRIFGRRDKGYIKFLEYMIGCSVRDNIRLIEYLRDTGKEIKSIRHDFEVLKYKNRKLVSRNIELSVRIGKILNYGSTDRRIFQTTNLINAAKMYLDSEPEEKLLFITRDSRSIERMKEHFLSYKDRIYFVPLNNLYSGTRGIRVGRIVVDLQFNDYLTMNNKTRDAFVFVKGTVVQP